MNFLKFIVNTFTEKSILLADSTMKIMKKTKNSLTKPEIVTFPSSEEQGEPFLKPLSAIFYSNLLRLEDKILRKDFSENTINEIILHYAVFFLFKFLINI